MSNVRRLASEWATSVARQGQFACVHRRKKHCWKAALLSQQVGALARAVRPLAASARPCCIARAPPSKNRGGSLVVFGAHQLLGLRPSRPWPFPCAKCCACQQALNAPRIQRRHSCCTQRKCPDGRWPNHEYKCKVQRQHSCFVCRSLPWALGAQSHRRSISRLTASSRGRQKGYALSPPLMSNVRRRE
jgi:hypothetical protein